METTVPADPYFDTTRFRDASTSTPHIDKYYGRLVLEERTVDLADIGQESPKATDLSLRSKDGQRCSLSSTPLPLSWYRSSTQTSTGSRKDTS